MKRISVIIPVYNAEEYIDANIKEAVVWFKNPANSARVDAWKNKLKHI